MKEFVFNKYVFCLTLCFLTAVINVKAATVLDYDGDGRTDVLVRRLEGSNHIWYALQSRDGFRATIWGGNVPNNFGDGKASADYDGDGKTDIAVIRGLTNDPNIYWYILNSRDNTMTAVRWGLKLNDYMVPQDYDGDGRNDIAVYRLGWWYILQSSNNQFYAEQFGRGSVGNNPADIPLTGGDYDGDGKADLAVVRYTPPNPPGTVIPMTLYIRRSLDRTWASYSLGDARFTGVLSGDYDGDRKADVAIWQGNLWLWIRSSDNQLQGVRFGDPGRDIPAQGDYDGDGKTDPAVYRVGDGSCAIPQQQSHFHILQSRDGYRVIPWGLTCDEPEAGRGFIRAVGF